MTNPQGQMQPSHGDRSDETAFISTPNEYPPLEIVPILSPNATLEQRQLWNALQESEEHFREIFELQAIGLAHISTAGRWLRVNQKLCDILGYSKRELTQINLQELTPATDLNLDRQQLKLLLSGQLMSYAVEKRLLAKNGQPLWTRQTVSMANTLAHNNRYLILEVEDISDFRRAEEERAFEQAEFNEILRQMPGGVMVVDAQGNLKLSSQRIHETLRKPPLSDHNYTTAADWTGYHPDGSRYQDAEWPLTRALLQGETVENEEIEFLRGDDTRGVIRVSAAPLNDATGQRLAAVATFYDISEYRELEHRKDEFISMASHELKTPITTIKAFAQFLQRTLTKQGLTEPVEYLVKIDYQISKLTKLIADLLDITKIQAGKLALNEEPFDLGTLIKETVEEVQQSEPAHNINVSWSTPLARPLLGDKDRLSQVLINMLSNACKYSPASDHVDVRITPQTDQVVISVQDYGVGIPIKHQEKIFERFYRVYSDQNKAFPGLGIGLYISNEIVRLHGGELWFESIEGQGTTFHFSLPFKPLPTPATTPNPDQAPAPN